MYSFRQKKANEKFGFSDTLTLVENIVSRAEENYKNYDMLLDGIQESVDCEMIYTQNQWTIIAFYSNPDRPIDIYQALDYFIDDIIDCYEEI